MMEYTQEHAKKMAQFIEALFEEIIPYWDKSVPISEIGEWAKSCKLVRRHHESYKLKPFLKNIPEESNNE